MTCKDCIHYEVCQFHIDEETKMTVAECDNFKDKHNLVEAVRCKDCVHRRETLHRSYCLPAFGLKQITDLNSSCSHGVRKKQEDIDE